MSRYLTTAYRAAVIVLLLTIWNEADFAADFCAALTTPHVTTEGRFPA